MTKGWFARNRVANRRILAMAGPITLANLSQPLLGLADSAITGHLEAPHYLAGVAIGTLIFTFVYWGLGFLRLGTTGPVAQNFGAGNSNEMGAILIRACLLSLLFSFLLVLFHAPIITLGLHLIAPTPETGEQARIYYNIRIFGAPAALLQYVFIGWFFGMQESLKPMIIQTIGHGLNILLSIFFVFSLGWKTAGVAWGTVIADYFIAFLLGLMILNRLLALHKKNPLTIPSDLFAGEKVKRLMVMNFDIFIRTILLLFAFAFFTAQSTRYQDIGVAANAILIQLTEITAFSLDGFAFTAEAIIGSSIGARKADQLKTNLKLIFLWAGFVALIFTLIYGLGGWLIISLITDIESIRLYARQYLFWAGLMPLVAFWCYIWDGVYFGATETRLLRQAMVFSVGVYIALVYLFQHLWGNHGLWLALHGLMVMRGLTLWVGWHYSVKKRRRDLFHA